MPQSDTRRSFEAPEAPYAGLTPDVALNALDAAGLATTGSLLALNSYENRVFQVGVDDGASAGFVVAKFYRPLRWSDEQIIEEHAFVAELAAAEVTAIPALTLSGGTLNRYRGYRYAVFARRGGRAPQLDDPDVLKWIGRFLGRLHAVGAHTRYAARPALDIASFGHEPRAYLLEHDWLPPELRTVYEGVSRDALELVQHAFDRAGAIATIRLHGDVHEGNVLWYDGLKEHGPHFVDFDDSRMGPAVQDLWMLLGADRDEQTQRLSELLEGYQQFRMFDRRELALIEPLRTLRLIHYAAWIARRWHDPAFPAAFPWFGGPRYWQDRILELREQIAAMQEPPLVV
jgi:Ser/Thr protein kinase RdoA (MazF antagonist)